MRRGFWRGDGGIKLIDNLGDLKHQISEFFTTYVRSLSDCLYADIRIEMSDTRWASAEDGKPKSAGRDEGGSFGIRVIAGGGKKAPGYYGSIFSIKDLHRINDLIKDGLNHAHARAIANSKHKSRVAASIEGLDNILYSTELANIEIHKDTVPAVFKISPESVSPQDILIFVEDASKSVKGLSAIKFNDVTAYTQYIGTLFINTEGALIDQYYAYSQGNVYVVASGKEGQQELYEYVGDQRGWEAVGGGVNVMEMNLLDFSMRVARDAVALSNAKMLKTTEKEVVVVTDPYFNTLLSHEIIGHPMEADRVLKYETAYAGRSWFYKGLNENYIGKQVASPLITTYSDPALPGYGHYVYDDEGTKGRKVVHMEKGILRDFMNSRQTASLLGMSPNGSYTATDASLVPLIRMSTTVFANGNTDPKKIIGDISDGYYLWGMHTPSISESRENFSMSAIKTYRIHRGEITELYRGGGISADSMSFLMSIDAVGNDFKIYPIANCGKGQPMQTKRLGNGGPTLRGRARVVGGS